MTEINRVYIERDPEVVLDFWDNFDGGANVANKHLWPAAIEVGSAAVALAFVDDNPAGWAATRMMGAPSRTRRVKEVVETTYPGQVTPLNHSLYVAEAYRRRGLGTGLTKVRDEEIARRLDVAPRAVTTIMKSNRRSIDLHKKLGYVPIEFQGQEVFRISVPDFDAKGNYTPKRERSLIMVYDLSDLRRAINS